MSTARTSETLTLPPSCEQATGIDLLRPSFGTSDWRLLEAQSLDSLPFELCATWAQGSASGANARISVATGARLCLMASELHLSALNRAPLPNRVLVHIASAFAPTRNVLDVSGRTLAGVPVGVPIPPFATHVRLDLASLEALLDTRLTFYDGSRELRLTLPATAQPAEGIPLGSFRFIEVTCPLATSMRALFTLSL